MNEAMRRPPFYDVLWDDVLHELPTTQEALFKAVLRTERMLVRCAHTTVLSQDFVADLHRELFKEIFPRSAGGFRRAETGFDIPVEFGFNVGAHYRDIPEKMAEFSRWTRGHIQDLDRLLDSGDSERFVQDVLLAAAYAHCTLVAIHPFLNGNGRASRLCINYFANRYGLLPIPILRDRSDVEYRQASDDWIRYHNNERFPTYLRQYMVDSAAG